MELSDVISTELRIGIGRGFRGGGSINMLLSLNYTFIVLTAKPDTCIAIYF